MKFVKKFFFFTFSKWSKQRYGLLTLFSINFIVYLKYFQDWSRIIGLVDLMGGEKYLLQNSLSQRQPLSVPK